MRSSRLCSVRNAARFIASSSSTSYFNGYIPFEKFTKSVTFDGDCGIPQVELKFNVDEAEWLHQELKKKIVERYAYRINAEGDLIIVSRRTRSEQLNVADCFDKLRTALYDCDKQQFLKESNIRTVALKQAKEILAQYKLNG